MRAIVAPLVLACAAEVHAAHPLLSEDTGTQGSGKFELELGSAWTRDDADRSYEFGPQLSYGMAPNLDGIVRPTWLAQRSKEGGTAKTNRGAGDTAIDVKWRFYEAGPASLAVRAGMTAPTAEHGFGAGKATYHALAVASFGQAELALHGNLGYTRANGDAAFRRDLFHFSTAAVVTQADWKLLLYDAAVDTNPKRARATTPAVVRFGAIYSLREGCDVDVGYQARINRAAPGNMLLAGLTLRW